MKTVVGLDFETDRIQPGVLAPPPVCMSVAVGHDKRLYVGDEMREVFVALLKSDAILAVANGAYDTVVAAAEWPYVNPLAAGAAAWPNLLPLIFDKYERGEVFDVLLAQALDAIAKGCFCLDPKTRKPMRRFKADGTLGPNTDRYSLELVVWYVLDRADAKKNDEYKLRYHELRDVPLKLWPPEAVQYPLDDAANTREVALAQMGAVPGRPAHENLHFMVRETRAGFALQLSSVYGLRTDAEAVERLETSLHERLAQAYEQFSEVGLLFKDEDDKVKENGTLKRTMVARAYGAKAPCAACAGTGKVKSPKSGNDIQCKACSATGLKFAPGTPLNRDGDRVTGICADRDALKESGDDVLEGYAEVSEIRRGIETYLPWLQAGTKHPLNVSPNVIGGETDRTSYAGLIQLLPRKGGFRECFVPRQGRSFCSVDYAAVELSTFAEVLLEVIGWSRMAEAINADKDLHCLFATRLANLTYEEVKAQVAKGIEEVVKKRFMSKEGNFGFGGRMGPARFAGSVRKPPKNLRLCIADGKAPKCTGKDGAGCTGKKCRQCHGRGFLCGLKKAYEWGKVNPRPIPPTCVTCIEVAEDLRAKWLQQWAEVPEYFRWVDSQKHPVTGKIRMRTPITGFVRGELIPSEASNHPFQHLAAVGAKEALWLITRECYLDRSSPLFGSRILVFAHDETIMEHDRAKEHEAAHRQAELMLEGMRKVVKRVKVKAEPALMMRWLKEAAPRFDSGGRLVPWEPEPKAAVAH